MPLTDTAVRQARSTGKDYTLRDGDGLALFVGANGAKNWHFRFSWAGKQPRISLGTYPEISLKEARELRDHARALVAKGVDPRINRRQERKAALVAASNTFRAVFQAWRGFKSLSLKTGRQSTLSQIDRIFEKDLLPTLGPQSIFDITRGNLLEVLRKIERRRAFTTAEKCRTWLNQLFRYAMVEVELQGNPAADLDIVAMPKPRVKHNPFLRMEQMPALLAKLHRYGGDLTTQLGLRLLLLTGVRTGELRSAAPEQFDLERGLWIIPPENVKQLQEQMRKENKDCTEIPPYLVPLPRQAMAIVRELLRAKSPAQRYLLPHRSKPRERISENTLNAALKRMGYKDQLTGHGIRATISTALNELGCHKDWVEAQLSHADPNQIRATYNHAEYVEQRRAMMQDWADRLDQWEMQGLQADPEMAPSIPRKRRGDDRPLSPVPAVDPLPIRDGHVEIASAEVAAGERDETEKSPVLTLIARSDQRPQPVLTDIQRERALTLATFESPHNLPLPAFAKLVGKSRHQINRDIQARRLLSLAMGNRGQRIPDWQLDPVRQDFTRAVLARVGDLDSWMLYRALCAPVDALGGLSPLEAVVAGAAREAMHAVLGILGVLGEPERAVMAMRQVV
ncbi:MAG TPA: tyrosine-type recombinase/integrase [Rhodocyclaceae bacterium]|nr:tyrosine-type recombinase/integrase [Rhodocyclaceae bacterium]